MFYTVDIKEGIKENAGFPISAIRINLDRDNDTILSGMEKIVLADVTNRIRINKKTKERRIYLLKWQKEWIYAYKFAFFVTTIQYP